MPDYDETNETDGFLIESKTVPGTSFRRTQTPRQPESTLDDRIGEVINHVILDHYIIFTTHLNKVFAYPANIDATFSEPVELTTFSSASPDFHIEDVQGSFRRFGVFSNNGAVLLGDSPLIEAFIQASHATEQPPLDPLPQPEIIPALQNSSVISLAFGDYHFHALHADGTISSHGTEPSGCGAFGFGSSYVPHIRGATARNGGWTPDRTLQIPSWGSDLSKGRRTIWFEPEKVQWLKDIFSRIHEAGDEGRGRFELMERSRRGFLEAIHVWGEWFEQEGRAWYRGPQPSYASSAQDTAAEADKGAYFALKIAAAGWHSAALVLVDDDKAERVRQKWLVKPKPCKVNENAGNEEAASKAISAPGEQLAAGIRAIGSWLYEKGRVFLGLAESHAAEVKEEEPVERERYVWEGQGLPRLRMANGVVMPGEQPLAQWRDKEPDFYASAGGNA